MNISNFENLFNKLISIYKSVGYRKALFELANIESRYVEVINEDQQLIDYIKNIVCRYFHITAKELENGVTRDGRRYNALAVSSYLILMHTGYSHSTIADQIKSQQPAISKYLKYINELNEKIPDQKIILKKIDEIQQQINYFKKQKLYGN